MSEGFEVDLDELRAAAGRLATTGSDLGTCRAGGEDAYGDDSLAAAAHDFRRRWTHELNATRDDLAESSARLRQTADSYHQTDLQVAERMRRLASR